MSSDSRERAPKEEEYSKPKASITNIANLENYAKSGNLEGMEQELENAQFERRTLGSSLLSYIRESRTTGEHVECANILLCHGAILDAEDNQGMWI